MWTVRLLVRSLPFQGSQVGFESHTVYHKIYSQSVSGLYHLFWEQDFASSNLA